MRGEAYGEAARGVVGHAERVHEGGHDDRAEDAGGDDENGGQRRRASERLSHGHRDTGRDRLRRKRDQDRARRAERFRDQHRRRDRHNRADEQRRRERPDIASDEREVGIDRHAKGDRRRPEQEMHELGTVEISLVVRPGELEQSSKQGDGDQDVVDDRAPARRLRQRVGEKEGCKRRRQPEERRRLQINPEAERRHASPFAPVRRLTSRKTPTVARSVATVETTSATASAKPCSRNRPMYCTTPTPAGTNKSGKAASSPLAALPRSLSASASSSSGRERW